MFSKSSPFSAIPHFLSLKHTKYYNTPAYMLSSSMLFTRFPFLIFPAAQPKLIQRVTRRCIYKNNRSTLLKCKLLVV